MNFHCCPSRVLHSWCSVSPRPCSHLVPEQDYHWALMWAHPRIRARCLCRVQGRDLVHRHQSGCLYLGYPVSEHSTILCGCPGTSTWAPSVNLALGISGAQRGLCDRFCENFLPTRPCRLPPRGLNESLDSPPLHIVKVGSLHPFTPKSDQCRISPAASPEILHHTVWRTWLFIAYSDERWLYCNQFSLPRVYIFS